MTYIPQGYQNTVGLLTFFAVDSYGFLKNANIVEYKINDPDGVQVEPVAGWTDVTSIGAFSKGCYYAVTASDTGWTVPGAADVGKWSIDWRWKLEAGDDYSTWSMKFDVVESRDEGAGTGFNGVPFRMIVSPLAIRNHGLTVAQYNDGDLEALMLEAQSYLETACRQQFRPGLQTLKIQGGDSDRLFFGQPILGVSHVRANNSTADATESALAVEFSRIDQTIPQVVRPDPRRQPTISWGGRDSVFTPSFGSNRSRFRSSRKGQEIKAVFGFLEQDGTVPALLRRAFTIIVYNTAVAFSRGSTPVPAGPMTSKTVDRHSVSYANAGTLDLSSALARTREVQEIVRIYKAPLGLGSPDPIVAINRV